MNKKYKFKQDTAGVVDILKDYSDSEKKQGYLLYIGDPEQGMALSMGGKGSTLINGVMELLCRIVSDGLDRENYPDIDPEDILDAIFNNTKQLWRARQRG